MTVNVKLILFIAFFICLTNAAYGFQIKGNQQYEDFTTLSRVKRQVESLDDGDDLAMAASSDAPEEVGFWDRLIQVAIKMFSRFVEWLNSS